MKRNQWVYLAAMLGVMGVSTEVRAADEPPFLKVEFDANLKATLVLQNAGALTVCKPYVPERYVHLVRTDGIPLVGDAKRKTSRPLNMFEDGFFNDLRVGAQWNCSTNPDAPGMKVSLREATLPAGVFNFPEATLAPLFESSDWLSLGALSDILGSPVDCGYYPPGAKPPKDLKNGLEGKDDKHPCSLAKNGTQWRAQIRPNDVTAGQMAVLYNHSPSKTSRVVLFDIAACTYNYSGPLPALVQGARKQHIVISASSPVCARRLSPTATNTRLSLLADGATLLATSPAQTAQQPIDYNSAAVELDIEGIPAGTKAGVYDWKLRSGSDDLGTVRAEVLPAITVSESLSVFYTDAAADALQSRGSTNGIAVVDPPKQSDGGNTATGTSELIKQSQVRNTATVIFPEALSSIMSTTLKLPTSPGAKVTIDDTKVTAHQASSQSQRFWTLKQNDATGWNLSGTTPFPFDNTAVGFEGHSFIDDAAHVTFSIDTASKDPLLAGLRLYEARTLTGGSNVFSSTPKLLLEIEAKLANSARTESLPLPLADALNVYCFTTKWKDLSCTNPNDWPKNKEFDIASRGEQKAIDMQAMEDGYCWLALDKEKLGKNPEIYGPQSLRVTVHRENAEDKPALWPVNLALPGQAKCTSDTLSKDKEAANKDKRITRDFLTAGDLRWFQLEAPKGENNADATYVVRVEVAAESKQYATYRNGVDSNARTDERRVRPEQVFETRLRSRGRFGSRSGVRYFLTVPVVSGFRLPASSTDLKSTRDSEVIQAISPRVGLLATVEPWDYDKSKNCLPVPLRLQAGLHMFQFTQGGPAFSALLGVSAALPIFESSSPQLQSSANVGVFYELDLREIGGDFDARRQSHVLISLGFNVFSLLGSK